MLVTQDKPKLSTDTRENSSLWSFTVSILYLRDKSLQWDIQEIPRLGFSVHQHFPKGQWDCTGSGSISIGSPVHHRQQFSLPSFQPGEDHCSSPQTAVCITSTQEIRMAHSPILLYERGQLKFCYWNNSKISGAYVSKSLLLVYVAEQLQASWLSR